MDVARKRVPILTGTTSLNTRRTLEKARWAESVGSDGLLNGVPMWLPPSWQNAVQFYKDLAEAMPNMAIMIYHNPPGVPRHHPPAGWKQLAQVRNIVAVKQTVTEMRHWISVRDAVGQNITILVSDNVAWPTAMFGAGGVWSTRSSGARRRCCASGSVQPRRLAARGGDPARAVRHLAARSRSRSSISTIRR